jgi:uncharacterized protein YicC (UPF0701 family)
MPVYSMTGYASAQQRRPHWPETEPAPPRPARLGLEIRSVNSRFLDLSFACPTNCAQHEPALRSC